MLLDAGHSLEGCRLFVPCSVLCFHSSLFVSLRMLAPVSMAEVVVVGGALCEGGMSRGYRTDRAVSAHSTSVLGDNFMMM